MLEKLIYSKTKRAFNKELDNNNVHEDAIAFIEDTKEIYTHGNYFDGNPNPTKVSQLENDVPYVIDNIIPSKNGVYIYSDNTFTSVDSFSGTNGMVAVIDDKSSFLIHPKSDANRMNTTNDLTVYGLASAQFRYNQYNSLLSAYTDFNKTGENIPSVLYNYNSKSIYGLNIGAEKSDEYPNPFIGTVGQWNLVMQYLTEINNAINKLNGNTITSDKYWTSSEYDGTNTWYCIPSTNTFNYIHKGVVDNGGTNSIVESSLLRTRTFYSLGKKTVSDRLQNLENKHTIIDAIVSNTVTDLPIDVKLIVATIASSSSFSLTEVPEQGREIHILVNNNGTSDITITLPTASPYVPVNGDHTTVPVGGYAEINAISDGTKIYLRAL